MWHVAIGRLFVHWPDGFACLSGPFGGLSLFLQGSRHGVFWGVDFLSFLAVSEDKRLGGRAFCLFLPAFCHLKNTKGFNEDSLNPLENLFQVKKNVRVYRLRPRKPNPPSPSRNREAGSGVCVRQKRNAPSSGVTFTEKVISSVSPGSTVPPLKRT